MPEDKRAEPPEAPPTIKLDAVQVLSELIRAVAADVKATREEAATNAVAFKADFVDVKADLVEVKADFGLLSGQFEGLEKDVRGMQSWRVRVDDRLTSNSMRAKAPSSMDLDHEARLAQEIIERKNERAAEVAERIAIAKDLALLQRNDEAQNIELRAQSGEARVQSVLMRDVVTTGNAIAAELGIDKRVSDDLAQGKPADHKTIRQMVKASKWSGYGVYLITFAFFVKVIVDLFKK